MEVWVLEEYLPEEGCSETLGVYENADVAMNRINKLHQSVTWNAHENYWSSHRVDDIIYYINKFAVVLDEVPN
jgi:hypothetical protein